MTVSQSLDESYVAQMIRFMITCNMSFMFIQALQASTQQSQQALPATITAALLCYCRSPSRNTLNSNALVLPLS